MKPPTFVSHCLNRIILFLLLAALALGQNAASAALTWDPSTGTGSSPNRDGTGSWGTTTPANWWNGTADVNYVNTSPYSDVIFGNGGAGGTVTVVALSVKSFTFNTFSGTYIFDAASAVAVTLRGATLTMNSGAGAVTFNANAKPTLSVDTTIDNESTVNVLTISGVIAGAVNVTKTGPGTLTLSGQNNTWIGASKTFELKGGTLNINQSKTLGTGNTTFQIDDGTTIDNTSAGNITLGQPYPININGNFTFTGTHNLTTAAGAITLNGASGARTITANAGTLTLGGPIANGTATGITKAGAGTLTLSGANTYTGGTTVNDGTLQAGVASVAGTSGAFGLNSAVTMANVATAILNITGFNTQIGSLTGGGTTGGNVTLGAATLTVGGDNTSPAAHGGIISGTGGLTKIGSGTLTLSGVNTYTTGATVVNGGALLVNSPGSLAAGSAVTVGGVSASGTPTLGGSGTINGTVNISAAGGGAAGHLAPGKAGAAATLNTGALTLGDTVNLDYILNTPNSAGGAGGNDYVNVTGNLTINPNVTLTVTPGASIGAGKYHLIKYSGTLTDNSSSFTGWTMVNAPGYSATFSVDSVNQYIDVTLAATSSASISTSGTPGLVNTTYGYASTSPSSFSVSGVSLTGNLIVTPPSGYEVSLSSGSGYTTSLSITASGTLTSTPVYVRLAAGTAAATYSGNITISGGGATAVNVATTPSTVSKKTLTITGISVPSSKVYDATTAAVVSGTAALLSSEAVGTGTSSDGVPITGDDVSLTGTATGTYNSKDVATATTVTYGGLSLAGAAVNNYTLTIPSPVSATIIKKTLFCTGLSAASKVYDGTTTAALTGTAALLTAEASGTGTTSDGAPYTGDLVTLSGTTGGTLAARGVGIQAVTITGKGLTGNQAGNYNVPTQQPGLTQTITPKALTVQGITAPSTVYDGTTTAKLTGTAAFLSAETAGAGNTGDGKPYSVDSILIGGTATGILAAKDVGTQAVTISGNTVMGTDSGNYTVTQQSGLTQIVTAKALTVTGLSASSSKVYDGTTNASVSGSASLQTSEAVGNGTTTDGIPYTGDTVNILGTPVGGYNSKNVASATMVTFTGLSSDNSNYTITAPTQSATITKLALSVTAPTIAPKVYNGSVTAGVVTVGTISGEVGTEKVTATAIAADYPSANVGTYPGTVVTYTLINGTGGGLAANYSLANDTATGTINKATPTISGVTGSQSINYGTANVTLSGTVSAGSGYPANGETVIVIINGNTQPATITGGAGGFSVSFPTATILPSPSAYTISYAYAGNANLNAAANNTSTALSVTGVQVPNLTFTNAPGVDRIIMLAEIQSAGLVSSQGSPTYSITSVSATSAGGTVIKNGAGTVIKYSNSPSFAPASDSFTYTITDGTASGSGTVTLNFANVAGPAITPGTDGSGHAVISFHGIPGYSYHVQRATLLSPADWTNAAPVTLSPTGDGSYSWTNTISPADGFYRLSYP